MTARHGDYFFCEINFAMTGPSQRFFGQAPQAPTNKWQVPFRQQRVMLIVSFVTLCKTMLEAPLVFDGSTPADEALAYVLQRCVASWLEYAEHYERHFPRPDGTPRKLLDTTLVNSLGWEPQISLSHGLYDAFNWYLNNLAQS